MLQVGVVQAHRNTSKLHELHHHRYSMVCSVLMHQFRVVQAHRISSSLIEPTRTTLSRDSKVCRVLGGGSSTSNLIEPAHTTPVQRQQGVQVAYALVLRCSKASNLNRTYTNNTIMQQQGVQVVQTYRTSSNLHEPHHYCDSKVCRVLLHQFGVVQAY